MEAPNGNWRTAVFFDDAFGTVVDPRWNFVNGGNGSCAFAVDKTDVPIYGKDALTSGASGVFAADQSQINLGALNLIADNPRGSFFIKARFKLSTITTMYAFFGVTDKTTIEAPIISAGSQMVRYQNFVALHQRCLLCLPNATRWLPSWYRT